MRCRIKFCGLRTEEDVAAACSAGAWAVGFVLTGSARQVDLETCRRLGEAVDARVLKVGVFADEPAETIRRAVKDCRLDLAQVHAERSEEEWQVFRDLPVVRAIRVRGPESLQRLEAVRGRLFLLDAYVEGSAGGTGRTFDWSLARSAASVGCVILAGGLTPENVAEAIREARPWAVDVSSGIEREKGVKDPRRMRAFARAVHQACEEMEDA
ncbi:MAG: phosphoribosylanthranilate isomerase [Planctomycetota bacterium]